jgi:hypothetical protein
VERQLKAYKPKRTKPRVCATCAHIVTETFDNGEPVGVWTCKRPNGPSFEVGDGEQWLTTCKGYKADEDNE